MRGCVGERVKKGAGVEWGVENVAGVEGVENGAGGEAAGGEGSGWRM